MTRGLYRWEVQNIDQNSSIAVDGPLIVNTAALALAGAAAGIGLAYLMDRRVRPLLEEVSVAAFSDGPLSKDFDGLPTSASRAL